MDIVTLEQLGQESPEKRELIAEIERDHVPVRQMSTLTQHGVMDLKKEVGFRKKEYIKKVILSL